MQSIDEKIKFLQRTYSKLKSSAGPVRGLEFTVSFNHILALHGIQKGKCAISGRIMEYTRGGNFRGCNGNGATIDRIDSSKGYIEGNVQLACWRFNCLKSDLGDEEFKDLCTEVHQYREANKYSYETNNQ